MLVIHWEWALPGATKAQVWSWWGGRTTQSPSITLAWPDGSFLKDVRCYFLALSTSTPGDSGRGQVESPFLNWSFPSFPAFSNALEEIHGELWVQGKGDSLHRKVLSVLVRNVALRTTKTEYFIYAPTKYSAQEAMQSRAAGPASLHIFLLPGCHKHLEKPWGQGTEHRWRAQWALLSQKSVGGLGTPKLSSKKQTFFCLPRGL